MPTFHRPVRFRPGTTGSLRGTAKFVHALDELRYRWLSRAIHLPHSMLIISRTYKSSCSRCCDDLDRTSPRLRWLMSSRVEGSKPIDNVVKWCYLSGQGLAENEHNGRGEVRIGSFITFISEIMKQKVD